MTSLKTSIKTITYLSDIGCLEIQGASLHTVRNDCCHHTRLFNRNRLAPRSVKNLLNPEIPLVKMNGTSQDQCNRIYTSLAVIQNMLSAFGFEKFGEDIQALFDKYPVSKLFYASMGFPERWNEERLFF
ncbi:DNA methylase [Escherichia coli]|nr:DNA methylase [Escherichia coli]